MLVGRDPMDSWNGVPLGIKGMLYHLYDVLVEESDADIILL